MNATSDRPDWAAYLTAAMRAAGYQRASDLARAAALKHPLISRWMDGTSLPDVASLRKLSGPLGIPLLELMVAAGHLTPAEVKMKAKPRPPVAPDVSHLTDDELLEEVGRRLSSRSRRVRKSP